MTDADTFDPVVLAVGLALLVVLPVAGAGVASTVGLPPCQQPGLVTHEKDITPTADLVNEYRPGSGTFSIAVRAVHHTRCDALTGRNTGRLVVVVDHHDGRTDLRPVRLPFGPGDSVEVPVSPNATVRVLWYDPETGNRSMVLDAFEVPRGSPVAVAPPRRYRSPAAGSWPVAPRRRRWVPGALARWADRPGSPSPRNR